MKVRKWLQRVGWLLLAGLLFFVFGWAPYFLGGIATVRRFQFPDKENAGLDPKALGLAYEAVAFKSSDGVELKGWWVPVDGARGTVVLVHGLNRSRIEMVRKTPFLHEHGWNALLFDLRHHGESGGDSTTFGLKEREDVRAAIAEARRRSPEPVVLWGVSLGGASVVMAAAEDPSVAGVVCDSSYRDLPDTVRHHVALFRSFRWWLRMVPPWPLTDQVLFWIGRRGGFDPAGGRRPRASTEGRPFSWPTRRTAACPRRSPSSCRRRRAGRPRSWWCPARAMAGPGATAPPPIRPRWPGCSRRPRPAG